MKLHDTQIHSGSQHSTAVLASIKDKPFGRPPQAAVLDSRCADGSTSVRSGRKNARGADRTKEWCEGNYLRSDDRDSPGNIPSEANDHPSRAFSNEAIRDLTQIDAL